MGSSQAKLDSNDGEDEKEEPVAGNSKSVIPMRPSFTESYVHHLTRKRHTLEGDDVCQVDKDRCQTLLGSRGSSSNFTQSYVHHLSNNRDIFGYGSGRPSEDELARECKDEILCDPKKPYLNKLMEVRGLVGVSRLNALREQARRQRAFSKAKQEARKKNSRRSGDSIQDLRKDGISKRAEVNKTPDVNKTNTSKRKDAPPYFKTINSPLKNRQSNPSEKQPLTGKENEPSKRIHDKLTEEDSRECKPIHEKPEGSKRVKSQKVKLKTFQNHQKPKLKLRDNIKSKQINKQIYTVRNSKNLISESNKNVSNPIGKNKENLYVSSIEPIAAIGKSLKKELTNPDKTESSDIPRPRIMANGNKTQEPATARASLLESKLSLDNGCKNISEISSENSSTKSKGKCCNCACRCRKSQVNLEENKTPGSHSRGLNGENTISIGDFKKKLLKKSSEKNEKNHLCLDETNVSLENTLEREEKSVERIRGGERKLSLIKHTSSASIWNVDSSLGNLGIQKNEMEEKPPKLPPITELFIAIEESSKKDVSIASCADNKSLNSVKDIFFPNKSSGLKVTHNTRNHPVKAVEDMNRGRNMMCTCLAKNTSKEWPHYRTLEAR